MNSVVLQQFSRKGLTINEGVAVDARVVQSASHPISNEEIKKQRGKREGKLDKNGNPLKFSCDLDSDSDWVSRTTSPTMDSRNTPPWIRITDLSLRQK